ncbi:MAG: type II secretion system protein [Candidatus Omnitrophota bacterium]
MFLKKTKAFTLIETIIALAILGVGLVAVMRYFPQALDTAKRSADLTQATMIAQQKIEEIKAESFDNINNADSFQTSGFILDPEHSGFEYEIVINPLGDVTLKSITVRVRWQFKAKTISREFQTQIVKYEPA